jgi:Major tropism determinant N-terminal domain
MTVKIQVRRGTASAWITANTVLSAGEIGFETDTLRIKIGDGTTAWTSLGYASGGSSYATTATAAGTTTLTATSAYAQFFTGSTTQTVVLPVASTMTLGQTFYINNNSSGALTINSSGSNLVATVPANTTVMVTCILASGTSAASWDADYTGATTVTGTGSLVLGTAPSISNLTLTGTLTASSSAGTNGYYLQSTGTGVQWAAVSGYSAPTLGSTSIASGSTVTTISGLTLSGPTITGTLTAASSVGTSGQVLSSTGTGVQWSTPSAGAAFSEFLLIGA